ncbi:MAG: RluA family pseudouridine synthase [Candidatus Babeliales bacterium]
MKKSISLEHSPTKTIVVGEQEVGKRIDAALCQLLPEFSRTYFQELIERNAIMVHGKKISKSYRVKPDDVITISFPPSTPLFTTKVIPDNLGVEVLFENEHFLIVYKPAGLIVHAPHLTTPEVTLVDWLVKRYEHIKDLGFDNRPGIVHRLDKDTSGIIILAKTLHAHNEFARLFRERGVHKTYYALVQGHPERTGSINFPIARDERVRNRMTHRDPQGRAALTHYEVETYFKNTSLVKAFPVSGRTHQIRVHFAAIGHPIVGDALYGQPSKEIKRQALHAYKLSFEFDGVPYNFEKNIPADMQHCIDIQEKIDKNF